MSLTSEQFQTVQADLTATLSTYNTAYQRGDLVSLRSAADRANRDWILMGAAPQVLYPGYSFPVDYCSVPAIAGVPFPGCSTTSTATLITPSTNTATTTTTTPTSSTTPPIGPTLPKPRLSVLDYGLLGNDPGGYCSFFAFDPICGGGGWPVYFPFPFPGGGGGITNVTNVTVIEGVQESTVWSDIWGGLGTLWSIIVGSIDAALVAAIAGIKEALTKIAQALSDAFHALARLAGLILKFLQVLFHGIVKLLVRAVQEIVKRLGDLYEKVLKPILKALAKIRKKLLDIYNRFIRPAIIIIQRLRQILAILRIFHLKFAITLDKYLADLEQRILAPYLQLLGYINALGNWLNLITTAAGLLQKPIWLATFQAYRGSSIALQLNAMNRGGSPVDLIDLQNRGKIVSAQQTTRDVQTYLTAGGTPVSPLVDIGAGEFAKTIRV